MLKRPHQALQRISTRTYVTHGLTTWFCKSSRGNKHAVLQSTSSHTEFPTWFLQRMSLSVRMSIVKILCKCWKHFELHISCRGACHPSVHDDAARRPGNNGPSLRPHMWTTWRLGWGRVAFHRGMRRGRQVALPALGIRDGWGKSGRRIE